MYVLEQIAKILPIDNQAKRTFEQNDGLKKIQKIKDPNPELRELIIKINELYTKKTIQNILADDENKNLLKSIHS